MLFLAPLTKYKNIIIAFIILAVIISNLICVLVIISKDKHIDKLQNHIEILNEEIIYTSNTLVQYKSNLIIDETKSNYTVQIELLNNNTELSSNERYILESIYSNFLYLMKE